MEMELTLNLKPWEQVKFVHKRACAKCDVFKHGVFDKDDSKVCMSCETEINERKCMNSVRIHRARKLPHFVNLLDQKWSTKVGDQRVRRIWLEEGERNRIGSLVLHKCSKSCTGKALVRLARAFFLSKIG